MRAIDIFISLIALFSLSPSPFFLTQTEKSFESLRKQFRSWKSFVFLLAMAKAFCWAKQKEKRKRKSIRINILFPSSCASFPLVQIKTKQNFIPNINIERSALKRNSWENYFASSFCWRRAKKSSPAKIIIRTTNILMKFRVKIFSLQSVTRCGAMKVLQKLFESSLKCEPADRSNLMHRIHKLSRRSETFLLRWDKVSRGVENAQMSVINIGHFMLLSMERFIN